MSVFFHRIPGLVLAFGVLTLAACCPQTCMPQNGTLNNSTTLNTGLIPVTSPSYMAAPADILKITVYGENDLSGDYIIGPDGTIALPLIGAVDVGGKPLSALPEIIAVSYRGNYLKDPKVSVEVKGRAL